MDETHHRFSTKGNKGGSTTQRYANASFPRSGDRYTENSQHTTGVYGVTLGGEALPPLYILDTSSKNEDNYKIDPEICKGLPIVKAKYAGDVSMSWPSSLAVRKKGSMDTSLWTLFNKKIILRCYKGKLSPLPVRDPITLKMITGPLINKTDSGPGRLAKEASSFEFREEMATIGMHILLSLPNGTECTAEMDQLYAEFKPACQKSTVRVAGVKLAARLEARKKGGEVGIIQECKEESDDSDGKNESNDEKTDSVTFKRSGCNVAVNNRDLAAIVNGYEDDPI